MGANILIRLSLSLLYFNVATYSLKVKYYADSCSNVEKIVQEYVTKEIRDNPAMAASLLRLQFHDCFVSGCDASILLNGNNTEKSAKINFSLRGYDFIDSVKKLLEEKCPKTVSCADTISLVARDAIVTIGGPYWNVTLGRRDGTTSFAEKAENELPSQLNDFTTLEQLFRGKGLSLKDLVVLSGAHTIGFAHCESFKNRVYTFPAPGGIDPTLNQKYALFLKKEICTSPKDDNSEAPMDPGSYQTFDKSYYENLLRNKGLFESDATLTTNSEGRSAINDILRGNDLKFFKEFAISMEKMGQIGVLYGEQGEVRVNCGRVN